MLLVEVPKVSVVMNYKLEKWLSKLSPLTGSVPKSIPDNVIFDSPLASTGIKGGAVPVLGVNEND